MDIDNVFPRCISLRRYISLAAFRGLGRCNYICCVVITVIDTEGLVSSAGQQANGGKCGSDWSAMNGNFGEVAT